MAKKRFKQEVSTAKLPKVYATVEEYETGAKSIICPECGKVPILRSVDYGLTSDSKYVWFTHLCPNCDLHVVHFSHTGGGVVDVKNLYSLDGELISEMGKKIPQQRESKKHKKPLPKKVGKHEFILPTFE